MSERVRNYIHLIWTVFWTVPSLFLVLMVSGLVWQRPADSPASTGSEGESPQPAFTPTAVASKAHST